MKLNFNFTGRTLLKNWWKIVRDNFQSIETIFNAHQTAAELDHPAKSVKRRHIDNKAVGTDQIEDSAVGMEQLKNKSVTKPKLSEDLQNQIDNISNLQQIAHIHENKELLDSINSSRMERWDSKSEAGVKKEYVLQMFLNERMHVNELYNMLGYIVVDGGVFGMGDVKSVVDGSAFVGEPPLVIDCGGFEPRSIQKTVQGDGILDGGTY